MGVHLCKGANLRQVHIFPVAEGNNFIKGEYEGEGLVCYLRLIKISTVFWNLKNENTKVCSEKHRCLKVSL